VVAPEAPRRAARQRRHSSQGKRASLSPGDRARAAQAGQETLSDLLHHVGVIASCQAEPSSVTTADDTAPVLLTVEGEELGVLIGRRGESLAAMEYILNLMVQKQIGVWPSLQVDVAGYRRRREETLDGLARRMARRVSETQQPYTFEPMSPRERRILHLAIQEDDRVTTESTGEGDERRVVIYPAE
jgi:spoIIIJ-associated protein